MSAVVSDNETERDEYTAFSHRIDQLEIIVWGEIRGGRNDQERVASLEVTIEGFQREWLTLHERILRLEEDL